MRNNQCLHSEIGLIIKKIMVPVIFTRKLLYEITIQTAGGASVKSYKF